MLAKKKKDNIIPFYSNPIKSFWVRRKRDYRRRKHREQIRARRLALYGTASGQ